MKEQQIPVSFIKVNRKVIMSASCRSWFVHKEYILIYLHLFTDCFMIQLTDDDFLVSLHHVNCSFSSLAFFLSFCHSDFSSISQKLSKQKHHIFMLIYILTAENLGVCFSFFLENYLMDFSQTLPFSSLYCSQGYKQKSEMCCYFCLATKCEICQNLPVLAPIYGHF